MGLQGLTSHDVGLKIQGKAEYMMEFTYDRQSFIKTHKKHDVQHYQSVRSALVSR